MYFAPSHAIASAGTDKMDNISPFDITTEKNFAFENYF